MGKNTRINIKCRDLRVEIRTGQTRGSKRTLTSTEIAEKQLLLKTLEAEMWAEEKERLVARKSGASKNVSEYSNMGGASSTSASEVSVNQPDTPHPEEVQHPEKEDPSETWNKATIYLTEVETQAHQIHVAEEEADDLEDESSCGDDVGSCTDERKTMCLEEPKDLLEWGRSVEERAQRCYKKYEEDLHAAHKFYVDSKRNIEQAERDIKSAKEGKAKMRRVLVEEKKKELPTSSSEKAGLTDGDAKRWEGYKTKCRLVGERMRVATIAKDKAEDEHVCYQDYGLTLSASQHNVRVARKEWDDTHQAQNDLMNSTVSNH